MPLGEDYDLLRPFPGRTASRHGTDCECWICRPKDVDQLLSPGSQRMVDQPEVTAAPKPSDQPFQLSGSLALEALLIGVHCEKRCVHVDV